MKYAIGEKVLVATHLMPSSLCRDVGLAEGLDLHTGIVMCAPECFGTYEVALRDGSKVSAFSSDLSPS